MTEKAKLQYLQRLGKTLPAKIGECGYYRVYKLHDLKQWIVIQIVFENCAGCSDRFNSLDDVEQYFKDLQEGHFLNKYLAS